MVSSAIVHTSTIKLRTIIISERTAGSTAYELTIRDRLPRLNAGPVIVSNSDYINFARSSREINLQESRFSALH